MTVQKYLVPHLKPPNSSILEEDKDALTAKYDEVAEMLSSLDAETKSIKAGVEEQRKAVEEGVREVEEAVKAMREADKGRNEEMQRIKEDVDAMKEQLPKVSLRGSIVSVACATMHGNDSRTSKGSEPFSGLIRPATSRCHFGSASRKSPKAYSDGPAEGQCRERDKRMNGN